MLFFVIIILLKVKTEADSITECQGRTYSFTELNLITSNKSRKFLKPMDMLDVLELIIEDHDAWRKQMHSLLLEFDEMEQKLEARYRFTESLNLSIARNARITVFIDLVETICGRKMIEFTSIFLILLVMRLLMNEDIIEEFDEEQLDVGYDADSESDENEDELENVPILIFIRGRVVRAPPTCAAAAA